MFLFMKKILGIVALYFFFNVNTYAMTFNLPVLDCKWEDNEETIDLKQIHKKKDGSVEKTSSHYNFEFIGKRDNGNGTFDEKKISGEINRSTGKLKIMFSETWVYFFDHGKVSKDDKFSKNESISYGKCEKSKNKNL